MPTTQRMIIHWPIFFQGIRAAKLGATPYEVLDTALRHATPAQRPTVLAMWQREYPLVEPTKAQRQQLEQRWRLRWAN